MVNEFHDPFEDDNVSIDLSHVKLKPYDHQLVGIEALYRLDNPPVGRKLPGCFALFDEMGIGKTKQVIDAAQALWTDGYVSQVIIVAPGAVRSVWGDPVFGELKKHIWDNLPSRVVSYRNKITYWDSNLESSKEHHLRWVITNYYFIRREQRLYGLLDFLGEGKSTLLVLDESSLIKNWRARQTKAVIKLRDCVGRVVLLNGTPVSHSPRDMFAQGFIMDKRILDCKNYEEFMRRYTYHEYGCVARSWRKPRWKNLDDLQNRFKPYVLRRLKKDCLDLPEKLEPVTMTVPLETATWEMYKKLRNEFMFWLEGEGPKGVLKTQLAVVKALRLSQLCGGFLGGVTNEFEDNDPETKEVGREKLDLLLEWIKIRFEEDENCKLLIWCRFSAESTRILNEVSNLYPGMKTGFVRGGQSEEERDRAVHLLHPDTVNRHAPAVVVGSAQAGGMGLNMAGCHTVLYYSNDHSLKTRLQSEDRTHRPGQTEAVSYYDIVAVGPRGQRTMDHVILGAIREKEELAEWTTGKWRHALRD